MIKILSLLQKGGKLMFLAFAAFTAVLIFTMPADAILLEVDSGAVLRAGDTEFFDRHGGIANGPEQIAGLPMFGPLMMRTITTGAHSQEFTIGSSEAIAWAQFGSVGVLSSVSCVDGSGVPGEHHHITNAFAQARFVDEFRINTSFAPGTLGSVSVSYTLDGSFASSDNAQIYAAMSWMISGGSVSAGGGVQYTSATSGSFTSPVQFDNGMYFDMTLQSSAYVDTDNEEGAGGAAMVDLSGTFKITGLEFFGPDGRLLNPSDYTLVTSSGYNYEPPSGVPEPTTLILLGLGLVCAGGVRRFK